LGVGLTVVTALHIMSAVAERRNDLAGDPEFRPMADRFGDDVEHTSEPTLRLGKTQALLVMQIPDTVLMRSLAKRREGPVEPRSGAGS
jgi:hypothetical protein